MTPPLACYRCGNSYPFDHGKRCACGEPLWFDGTASAFSPNPDASGLRRYLDTMPIRELSGLGAAVGDTPLIATDRLDEFVGCRVRVKDESANPTGSFKDRGSAVGTAFSATREKTRVGTVSHGNMAISMSAHAANLGLECVVLVPADIPSERLGFIDQYGPNLIRIEGDYGRLYFESLACGSSLGIEFVNSDTPLRIAGQKTTAFEICEAERGPPDGIVLPVSSGGHASALWKGLSELQAAGEIDSMPPLYLVQAAACDPIAQAYRDDAAEVEPVESGETVAFSIANGSPPSGNRALTAVRRTGGAVVSVSDSDILEAKDFLAEAAGLCVEPASATAIAGLRHLCRKGVIEQEADIVAIATGTGFRETFEDIGATLDTVAVSNLEQGLEKVLH